jgi:hypothetical protein
MPCPARFEAIMFPEHIPVRWRPIRDMIWPNCTREANLVGQERRRTPRYPFQAFAEIKKDGSAAPVTTSVTELSLHGCFILRSNPFPQGTSFHIKIFTDTEFFESRATVVYSQPEHGMGVTFLDIRSAYAAVLRQWILKAMMKSRETQD